MRAGAYTYLPLERVSFGRPAREALAEEVHRIGARRVFIVTSRTLASRTPVIAELAAALGERHAGTFDGCVQHAPRDTVVAAAAAVRDAGADLILTVGGGTPIDTVKILQICLAHGVTDADGLDGLHATIAPDGTRKVPDIRPSPVRQVAVPTTLSGAEFSNIGAATNPRTRLKDSFGGFDVGARAVILDPAVTLHTPDWLWLSTGVRAIDHAVETLCSTQANAYCDGLALHALRLFANALPRTLEAPADLEARLACQQAAWLAASSIGRLPYGASHGIGHVLGAFADVPHGHTSCVMLPHVMRFNERATAGKQALIAEALGQPGRRGADAVAALIESLGQPTTLRAVGVKRDQLRGIAEGALKNMWVRTNPEPLRTPEDVMRLLEAAW